MNKTIKYFNQYLPQYEPSGASGGKVTMVKPECWVDDNEYVAERKLDGTRLKMHITNEGNRFDTRRVSKKTELFMERTNNIPHLRDLYRNDLEGTVLDGEGLAYSMKFKDTQSIIGSSPEKAWAKQETLGLLGFHAFDILFYQGLDLRDRPYKERHTALELVVRELNSEYVKICDWIVRNKKTYYECMIEEGDEGIMLKNLNSIYGDKKGLIKAKRTERWTMIVTGFKPGAGKYEGAVGSLKVSFYGDCADKFTYASGLDDAQRWDAIKNPQNWLGRVVEIEAQELTHTGSLRHPRFIDFRIDKVKEDCGRNQNTIVK